MRKAILKGMGFTLIETLISVGILAAISVIAVPILSNYVSSLERNSLNLLFRDSIIQARINAKTLSQTLTICPLDSNKECSTDWASGDIAVFRDINDDKQWDLGELLFKRSTFASRYHKIKFNRGSGKYIKAKHNGYFNFFGSFIFCELNGEAGNKLVISRSGRMRIDTVDSDDCEF